MLFTSRPKFRFETEVSSVLQVSTNVGNLVTRKLEVVPHLGKLSGLPARKSVTERGQPLRPTADRRLRRRQVHQKNPQDGKRRLCQVGWFLSDVQRSILSEKKLRMWHSGRANFSLQRGRGFKSRRFRFFVLLFSFLSVVCP